MNQNYFLQSGQNLFFTHKKSFFLLRISTDRFAESNFGVFLGITLNFFSKKESEMGENFWHNTDAHRENNCF
jgi:hypothetical protein